MVSLFLELLAGSLLIVGVLTVGAVIGCVIAKHLWRISEEE